MRCYHITQETDIVKFNAYDRYATAKIRTENFDTKIKIIFL